MIISGLQLEALLRPALVSINFHLGVLACIVFINQETQKKRAEETSTWTPSLPVLLSYDLIIFKDLVVQQQKSQDLLPDLPDTWVDFTNKQSLDLSSTVCFSV